MFNLCVEVINYDIQLDPGPDLILYELKTYQSCLFVDHLF